MENQRAARHCGVSNLEILDKTLTNNGRDEEIAFFQNVSCIIKFSAAFAMSWIKEHAADESCQRVMAYLLARMSDRRTKCRIHFGCTGLLFNKIDIQT